MSLFGGSAAGLVLWIVGVLFWLALSYAMVPGLMEGAAKPKPEEGLNGAWLLTVVGTQAVSLLACLLVPAFTDVAPTCHCSWPWRSGWSAACSTSG